MNHYEIICLSSKMPNQKSLSIQEILLDIIIKSYFFIYPSHIHVILSHFLLFMSPFLTGVHRHPRTPLDTVLLTILVYKNKIMYLHTWKSSKPNIDGGESSATAKSMK